MNVIELLEALDQYEVDDQEENLVEEPPQREVRVLWERSNPFVDLNDSQFR